MTDDPRAAASVAIDAVVALSACLMLLDLTDEQRLLLLHASDAIGPFMDCDLT